MPDEDSPTAIERLRRIYQDEDVEPPAGWDAVFAFEAEHGIVLPEPFREFVATVTTGGDRCGPPGYGLTTLAEELHGQQEPPVVLNEPFPLTSAWVWEEEPDGGPSGVDVEDVYANGALPLGTDGCAMDWVLVVSGPHRGHVWLVADVGAQPFGREFGHTTGASGFLGWVEHWHSQVQTFGDVDWWDAEPDASETGGVGW